jgi:hypothetical protein
MTPKDDTKTESPCIDRLKWKSAQIILPNVEMLHPSVDKSKIHHTVDLPQKVVRWHQSID